MPGKHADGYRAAYASADREAARRWRHDNPDEWRRLLDEHLARRGLKDPFEDKGKPRCIHGTPHSQSCSRCDSAELHDYIVSWNSSGGW